MGHPLLNSCDSLDAFAAAVIDRAIQVAAHPLEVSAWVHSDWSGPVPKPADALSATFVPVQIGWRWGPRWSTCWFALRGKVPTQAAGEGDRAWHLRFDSQTEAMLFAKVAGALVPQQGLDVNRSTAKLSGLRGGSAVELYVEAACNHPFGAVGLPWDDAEVKARWESATPGRLIGAELVQLDDQTQQLAWCWRFTTGLIRELCPPAVGKYSPSAPWVADQPLMQSGRAEQLHQALLRLARKIAHKDAAAVRACAPQLLAELRAELGQPGGASTLRGTAMGHAHIDTAWLWPLRETRRKVMRTFSNSLSLMNEHAGFRFGASSAQHYAMLEVDSPALHGQVQQRVREGRWETIGGMWVEPDCLIPGPESLIRQILVGTQYFDALAGRDAAAPAKDRGPRTLFLPDTFGFSPVLPQIATLCGLESFVTNKLSWNDTTPYPHTTFWWRGLDGTRILAHCTPNHDYNATNSARELVRAERCHRSKQLVPPQGKNEVPNEFGTVRGARFLHPYGFGDGGGGPTAQQVILTDIAAACEGVPALRHGGMAEFLTALHADVEACERASTQVPEVTGELALELHRGILTTQAWLKREMVRCERLLLAAEAGEVLMLLKTGERPSAAHGLAAAWRTLLTNQFHDILPGSSIEWVYADARVEMAEVASAAEAVVQQVRAAVSAIAADVKVPAEMPAAVRIVSGDDASRSMTLATDTCVLSIDALGQITSLRVPTHDAEGFEELLAAPANAVVLYVDTPRMWEAWDIDALALQLGKEQTAPATVWKMQRQADGSVRISITRPIGKASSLEQEIMICNGAVPISITSTMQYHEKQTLMKLRTALRHRPSSLRYDVGFGHIERPVLADPGPAFEVFHHRYVAAPLPGLPTLTLLNDCKFGSSVKAGAGGNGTVIELSIARGTSYPDANADMGLHRFATGIALCEPWLPADEVDEFADRLLEGSMAIPSRAEFFDALCSGLLLTDGRADKVLSRLPRIVALKVAAGQEHAERPNQLILRLVEHDMGGHTQFRFAPRVAHVQLVSPLEEPLDDAAIALAFNAETGDCSLRTRQFGIITLLLTLRD